MSEVKTPLASPPVKKSNCDLLTWKDPAASGKVFGSIVGSLLLLNCGLPIWVTRDLLLTVFLVSALAEYTGKFATGQGFVTRFKPAYKNVVGKYADQYSGEAAKLIKEAEVKVQEVLYSKDIEQTLKVAGIAFIFYELTSFFSLWTLLLTATLVSFTAPVIYLGNKKQIDDAVVTYSKVAKDKLAELFEVLKEKAGPHLKTAEQKLGPVGSFIKSKVPVRTAGSTVGESPAATSATTATTSTSASTTLPSVPSTHPAASAKIGEEPITNPLSVDDIKKQAEAAL
ncbi:hypothetical protein OGAPHI_001285 [Ogataea philodendri]|uniref:Reticulon-like protein n=1 Tax=Ogataea philodendri TaxID=1378263 RepID=A0A9P8PGC6_9ASCO|nr:uncharacterized protein OGAPHI_001285 [Ogataea philodendri]KAH3670769.1 hypothetical protein OGAPHI_001285 [Ogataea philodendri]